MLQLDQETVQLLKQTVEKDGFIRLPAQGDSMFPLIRNDDLCRFTAYDLSKLKKGDIVLFCTPSGQLVAHRFFYAKEIAGTIHFIFKGDTNLGFDEPVQAENVIGKLTKIEKQGTTLDMNDVTSVLWKKLIQSFPILSGWLRNYLNWRYSRQQRMNKITWK